jgi:hypothetical protein
MFQMKVTYNNNNNNNSSSSSSNNNNNNNNNNNRCFYDIFMSLFLKLYESTYFLWSTFEIAMYKKKTGT